MKLIKRMIAYMVHFRTKFKYGVIGFYSVVIIGVTMIFVEFGFPTALFAFFLIEDIYGSIVIITYLIEK